MESKRTKEKEVYCVLSTSQLTRKDNYADRVTKTPYQNEKVRDYAELQITECSMIKQKGSAPTSVSELM